MLVPNAPLRRAFLKSDLTAHELAARLGYMRPRKTRPSPMADARVVKRSLGLVAAPIRGGRPERVKQTAMREATALRYAQVLGLDPREIGL